MTQSNEAWIGRVKKWDDVSPKSSGVEITAIQGSKISFTHTRTIEVNGLDRNDTSHISGFIEFGRDTTPVLGKQYDVKRNGDVIGHAQFEMVHEDGTPHWTLDLFNVVRGRC